MSDSVSAMTYTTEDFLSSSNLAVIDETVAEVFAMMLGFTCEAIADPLTEVELEGIAERTALVGFSGAMRGACELSMTVEAARAIASAMLGGVPVDEGDESIPDAVGEMCNMIAGGWKNRVPSLSSLCKLSPPTVIAGRHYTIQMTVPSVKVPRTFRFEEHRFHLALECEEPPQG